MGDALPTGDALHAQLVRYYQHFNPEKASPENVSMLLKKYKGKEREGGGVPRVYDFLSRKTVSETGKQATPSMLLHNKYL